MQLKAEGQKRSAAVITTLDLSPCGSVNQRNMVVSNLMLPEG